MGDVGRTVVVLAAVNVIIVAGGGAAAATILFLSRFPKRMSKMVNPETKLVFVMIWVARAMMATLKSPVVIVVVFLKFLCYAIPMRGCEGIRRSIGFSLGFHRMHAVRKMGV